MDGERHLQVLVDYVRRRRLTWLGDVLRRPGGEVIRETVLRYAEVLLRQQRQDRVAAAADAKRADAC